MTNIQDRTEPQGETDRPFVELCLDCGEPILVPTGAPFHTDCSDDTFLDDGRGPIPTEDVR